MCYLDCVFPSVVLALSPYSKCGRWYSHLFVAFPVSHPIINLSSFFAVAMAIYFRGRISNGKKMLRKFIVTRDISELVLLFLHATICFPLITKFNSRNIFNSLWENIFFSHFFLKNISLWVTQNNCNLFPSTANFIRLQHAKLLFHIKQNIMSIHYG